MQWLETARPFLSSKFSIDSEIYSFRRIKRPVVFGIFEHPIGQTPYITIEKVLVYGFYITIWAKILRILPHLRENLGGSLCATVLCSTTNLIVATYEIDEIKQVFQMGPSSIMKRNIPKSQLTTLLRCCGN